MREGYIPVAFMLLVSEAMYYIIGSINKNFPALTSFSVYVWKQEEYILVCNRYERYNIPEKKGFVWLEFSIFILKCKNSNK